MIQSVIAEYLDAFRKKMVDLVVDHYSDDATLYDSQAIVLIPDCAGNLRGRRDITEYYKALFRAIPHNPSPIIRHQHVAKPHMILELEEARTKYCHVFEVRNDKIFAHRIYWGSLPSRWVLDKLQRL